MSGSVVLTQLGSVLMSIARVTTEDHEDRGVQSCLCPSHDAALQRTDLGLPLGSTVEVTPLLVVWVSWP